MCKSLRVFTCRFSFSCLRPYSDSIKRLLLENKEDFFSKSSINRVENHICRDIITHAPFCRIFFISSYPTFWKWNTFSRFNLYQTKKFMRTRKLATRIVAQRQEVTRRNGVRTLFFSGGNYKFPTSFLCQITNSAERRYLRECWNYRWNTQHSLYGRLLLRTSANEP